MFWLTKKFIKWIYKFTPNLKIRIFLLRQAKYKVGSNVYIPADMIISDKSNRIDNIIIGDRVSIGPGVIMVTDSSPNNSILSRQYPLVSGIIRIEDDVWIGAGAIILQNVTIGARSIIASGSVVIEDVSPDTLVGGVPSRTIKKLGDDRN